MIQALPPAPPALIAIENFDPALFPSININGRVMKLHGIQVRGDPSAINLVRQRVEKEGWKIAHSGQDGTWLTIDSKRRNLKDLALLHFRISNGDFGEVKVIALLLPN